MEIRGITKFTLIDYPGKLSCIIFVGGCNFRCPYCHNPHLVLDPEGQPQISEKSLFSFLEKRRCRLQGVVISGGEPSMYSEFADFARKIKSFGYFIKIDTNGSNPDNIIDSHKNGLIDAIGVDYKAPSFLYNQISECAIENIAEKVLRTIRYSLESLMPIDVRTTVHKKILSFSELKAMRDELNSVGVREWTLQQFHSAEMIDDTLRHEPTYSDEELIEIARSLGNHTRVRGLKGSYIFTL